MLVTLRLERDTEVEFELAWRAQSEDRGAEGDAVRRAVILGLCRRVSDVAHGAGRMLNAI